MSVRLRPMTAGEFETWLPRSRAAYAESMIASGGIDPGIASAKAEKDFAGLLPDGIGTAGQDVYSVEVDGQLAGSLWISERDESVGRALFVFEVYVDEAYRGRGVGRTAMVFAEEEARRRGIPRIALNVFGGNEVARGLYRSLGYGETAIYMAKSL